MNEWLNHPALKNMDPVKLELIKLAAKQTEGKNGKSLAPVMMSLISSAHKKGITFSPEEMSFGSGNLKRWKNQRKSRHRLTAWSGWFPDMLREPGNNPSSLISFIIIKLQ